MVSHKQSDYTKPNAKGGFITCSEMLENIWKKEFRKQKYHGDGTGPFKGDYQWKPRGRVFYNPEEDHYYIGIGSWINEHPEAEALIIEEFDLSKEKTTLWIKPHWDLGQTWNE